jgi:gamma-glutamylcyclotransferase (GGCT)/AIG2-like uncharacterized protein YtfP
MDRPTLFFYGTLKRGGRSHHLLAGQEFVCAAQTLPCYRLYENGRYPCLVHDPKEGRAIHGELWRVDEAALHRLDAYEGVPNLFQRQPIQVVGTNSPVWTYVYQGEIAGMRDSGNCWRER